MPWKDIQPVKGAREIGLILGSIFVATWPNLITNLLSDLVARGLQIETPAGAWSVIAAAVSTAILYMLSKLLTRPNSPFNTPNQADSNARLIGMQGGMLTLGIALSQSCQGMFSGPLSEGKLLLGVLSLIPALEGALGSQFVHMRNNQALSYLDTAIKQLVLRNPHVTERMIAEHARGLAKQEHATSLATVSQKDLSEMIRSRMVHLTTSGELNRYFEKQQRLSIVSFRDPNQWRIEKKEVAPAQPDGTSSFVTGATKTVHDTEFQKNEDLQRAAWNKWQANPADREALFTLFQQAFHSKHGLSGFVKFEVARMLNHILLSVVNERRDLTKLEQEKVMVLQKMLAEAAT